ncbi:MAG TPA: pyridoxal-phosphate dependent enzyme [Vicinamibacterales bacterium]|nr:pyridoxal-phosphate dependent enzyme [Vicinamibacterales bacterium]
MIDALQARRRIAPYIRRTPLVRSAWLTEAGGADVWLKVESLQVTSSFKSRGAFNAVLARLERGGAGPRQLVTASAGNHGRALAAAAEAFGLPLVVFTPAAAPAAKLDAIRRHGADLRAETADYDEAERRAKAYARDHGAEFISPYSDRDVIDGAATIALEIFEDTPDLDALVVPIGGGGMISGIGRVAKAIDPRVEIIGVELEVSHVFQTSLRAGHLVEIDAGPSIADGLGGNADPETITFDLIRQFVDRIVTVSEADLESAISGLVEHEHLIAEGAGAAASAAIASRRVDVGGRRVAAIVSGSNIDLARLQAVLRPSG